MPNSIPVKSENAMTVIARRYALTFEQFNRISKLAGVAVPQLHDYLAGLDLAPTGPNVFEYRFHDSPHGPRRIRGGKFTLAIAVPVSVVLAPPPPIEFITLLPFKYVELETNSFGDEWRRIRDLAEQCGFERSLVEREIYRTWNGARKKGTQVALQVGIK